MCTYTMWNVLYVHVCLYIYIYIYIYMIMYYIRQNFVSAHKHKKCSFVCITRAFSTLSQALTEVPYSLNTLIHSHMQARTNIYVYIYICT